MIGGTLMQTIILLIVTFRTDWDKEVYYYEVSVLINTTHTYIHIYNFGVKVSDNTPHLAL